MLWDRYWNKDDSVVPQQLLDEPQLYPGLGIYYRAFWELSSERQIGMGCGPIPHSAIVGYARNYRMSDDQEFDLIYLMRKMDARYLELSEKKAELQRKASKK
jgi:hypothetical protein